MSKQTKGIFTRFDERKQAVNTKELEKEYSGLTQQQQNLEKSINELTDKDMPDIETLNEDSDYSMFMSSQVSDSLKKKALKKLFLSPSINVLDELNDYDENYTLFEALGDIVPYDLKQYLDRKCQEITEKTLDIEEPALEQQDIKEKPTEAVNSDNVTESESDAIQNKDHHDN